MLINGGEIMRNKFFSLIVAGSIALMAAANVYAFNVTVTIDDGTNPLPGVQVIAIAISPDG